jgi:hypothetical protein
MHPEVQLQALIDNREEFDYEHWKAISTGGGKWLALLFRLTEREESRWGARAVSSRRHPYDYLLLRSAPALDCRRA